MSVSISYVIDNETCEHCNKSGSREDPVLVIVARGGEQRKRGERDIIWVHRSCVLRMIENTMKQVEKDAANSRTSS
jgi:hypothetical protein